MENELRTLRGKAQGAANLRMQTHPLFYTPSSMDSRNSIGNLIDEINIIKLHLQEKFGLDFDKARERFSKVRSETFDRYFEEELKKLADQEKLAEKAVEEAKRIVRENIAVFIDGKRVGWNDRLTDEITQQETQSILTMLFEVAPALADVQCLTKPDKYLEWLQSDFANHEVIWRQERNLSLRQVEDRVNATFEVVIICKSILKP